MAELRSEISLGKTGLRAGLLASLFLIIYFLLMRSFNLTGSTIAWSMNFIILFGGINYCYRYYRIRTDPSVDYLPGMLMGTEVTLVSVIIYTAFVFLYFSILDPERLSMLEGNILFMSDKITPLRAASATFIEGLSSGIVISFIMMQYYKSGQAAHD